MESICVVSDPIQSKKNLYKIICCKGDDGDMDYIRRSNIFKNPVIYFTEKVHNARYVMHSLRNALITSCINSKSEPTDREKWVFHMKLDKLIPLVRNVIYSFDDSCSTEEEDKEEEEEDEDYEDEDYEDDEDEENKKRESGNTHNFVSDRPNGREKNMVRNQYTSGSGSDHETEDHEIAICDDCIEEYLERKGFLLVPDKNKNVGNSILDYGIGQNIVKAPQIINSGDNNKFIIKQYFVVPQNRKNESKNRRNHKKSQKPVTIVPLVDLNLKKEIALDLLNKLTINEINEKQYKLLMDIIEETGDIALVGIITKVLINSFCTGAEIVGDTIDKKIQEEAEMSDFLDNN